MRRALLVYGAALAVAACHRGPQKDDAPPPVPSVMTPRESVPASFADVASAARAVDLRVEARRGFLSRIEPFLEPARAAVEKHFDGKIPFPLAFQAVSAGPGRTAVLVQATTGEARPMAFALEDGGAVVWSKDHPIGGVKPGVSEPSLSAGPAGHVSLAWCNASTDSVALRRWTEDGSAFADYEAFHVEGCDSLSVLYWPKHGFLLAVATKIGATVQLVTENGEHAFGMDGMTLPWSYRAPATVSFALDTEDTFLLFRLGQSGGDATPEYVFGNRYAKDGRALWPGPLSLKRTPGRLADPRVRLTLSPGADGAVRATLPGATAAEDVSVEVASDGAVTRR